LYGTQSFGNQDFHDYTGEGWKHYRIPVGTYYTGPMIYMTFIADHDVTTPTAESVFRNVRVYDEGAVADSYAFTLADLADGAHWVYARATDVAGNVSAVDSMAVEVDTMGPTVTIDAPTSGQAYNAAQAIEWSTPDADLATSEGLVTWTTFVQDRTASQPVSSGDVLTSEGAYFALAWGTDLLGNVGPADAVEFMIDATSPVVTLDATAGTTTSANVYRTGTAHDFDGIGIDNVYWRVNGQGGWTAVDTITDAGTSETPTLVTYSFTAPVVHGVNSFEVQAFDYAGNGSAITSDTVAADLEAPQITIHLPTGGARLSGFFDVEVKVTDDFVGVSTPTVMFWISQEGEVWRPLTLTSGTIYNGTYCATVDSWTLYDAPTTIVVRAEDILGNDENTSPTDSNVAVVVVTVDNDYPPAAPTGLQAGYISYSEVGIQWNKNSEPDLAHYQLFRRVEDGTEIAVTDLRAEPLYDTLNGTPLNEYDDAVSVTAPGYWRYAMRAVDLADNVSRFSEQIIVDPPHAPDNLMAIGRATQIDLTWRAVPEFFVAGYYVWRGVGAYPSTDTFTLVETVVGRTNTTYVDTDVVVGTTYWYYVKAYDGATNTSPRSNLAQSELGGHYTQGVLVRFEDQVDQQLGKQKVDWDFNDLGVKFTGALELVWNDTLSTDTVSTLTIDAELWIHDCSGNYDLYTALSDFVGTGTYSGTVYTHNNKVDRTIASHLYDRSSTDLLTRNMPLFAGVGAGGDKNEYRAVITLVIDNPASNPLGAFDKVPFDTWMKVPTAGYEFHIFDPVADENSDDGVYVEDDPDLGGWWLNSAIVIEDLDWEQPHNGKKVWRVYPDFVGYVKSYRSEIVENDTWYLNGPYNPN
jgi:hypothetical protein